jgi:hypothetical protein
LLRLRHALEDLRHVQHLGTADELAAAKRLCRAAGDLRLLADRYDAEQRLRSHPEAVVRTTTCLQCGRGQPASRPPRCPACGGPWFTS